MYKTLYFYILELLECMLLLFYRLRQDIEELTTVIFEYSRIYLVYLEVTWLAISAIQTLSST